MTIRVRSTVKMGYLALQLNGSPDALPRYAIAIASVVLATIMRMGLDPLIGERVSYITYTLAIIAVAWSSGLGPSLVTMFLGFLSAFYYFANPRGSFQVSDLDGQISAVSYIVTGLCIALFIESIRATERRARVTAARLMKQQVTLKTEILERKTAQKTTISLLHRLVNAQEAERRWISCELHDQCGQVLTALRFELKLLEDGLARQIDVSNCIRNLYRLLDRVSHEVYDISLKLRPSALDELGLALAITSYVDDWKALHGIRVECECRGWKERRIPEELETAMYRVLEEALTNVAKHARASSVNVVLLLDMNRAIMIVEDNGRGFDVTPEFNGPGPAEHFGLLSMRERMIATGGSLEVESAPGLGSTVYARGPASNVVA